MNKITPNPWWRLSALGTTIAVLSLLTACGGQDTNGASTNGGTTTATPTVSLSANPTTVVSGGTSTLTWSSSNASSCSASGAWGGSKAASGSQSLNNLTQSGTYTLTCGGSASLSVVVTVTSSPTADTTAPTIPTGLSASSVSSSQINLNWTASTDNIGVTAYRIYRGGVQVATSTTTSYANTGLSPATTYSYTVAAVDAAGNVSSQSASANATTQGTVVVPGSGTVPGTISAPNPTLNNISIEWEISGDTNNNGIVSVRYRKLGDTAWNQGMPLRRVPSGASQFRVMKNKHSGSILDLQPDTTYEIELSLFDPDGGSAIQTTVVSTRPVPVPMAGAPIKAVTPSTFSTVAAGALPGDILDLSTGTYAGFTFPRDGSSGRPIVIRASSGGVIVNGNINLDNRQWVYVDGLTVNGMIRMYGSSNMAVMRSTINTTGSGIVFQLRSENNYIADNRIIGITQWAASSLGVSGNNVGEGIQGTGPGHVIMNNFVQGFRDGISTMETGEAYDQYSIDILNNDINIGADDAIEADYCFNNCRIMRNRITNSFMGVSSQPALGGPQYIIRNVMYNVVFEPFKLHNSTNGNVILHNTVVKNGSAFVAFSGAPILRLYSRSNLMIGGPGGTYNGFFNGSGQVMALSDLDRATADLDFDAFGSTLGTFSGNFGGISFSSLSAMRNNTTEKNAIQVDLSVFATTVTFPSDPMAVLLPSADLRIRAGSPVENAGVVIPNVTDGFTGSAPDIGAYEIGVPLPVYGPR